MFSRSASPPSKAGSRPSRLASGQAAETLAILTLAKAGDNIVSTTSLYGGTYNLFHYTLPRLGITVKFADAADYDGLRRQIDDKTKAVYSETVGNPKLDVLDIEKLARLSHDARLPLIIDNTTPSPTLCRPFEWGQTSSSIPRPSSSAATAPRSAASSWTAASSTGRPRAASPSFRDPDPSYHGISYTQAFGNLAFIIKARVQGLRDTGACLSPFNAFLLLQGAETLHLRMQRHSENALAVARHLKKQPKVEWVNYPGLEESPWYGLSRKYMPNGAGALLTFGIKGGFAAGKKFINAVKLFSLLANIGDAKSLVIHPASTTHQQLSEAEQRATGVTPEMVRLSVGIEDIRDILADIDQALAQS